MNIIILGPQGSGKGTQAELISDKFNLFYLDMGKFLRAKAKKNPVLDRIINERGKLLPDGIVFSLMSEHVAPKVPTRDGILFDGYPRSPAQYELLKQWLGEKGKKIDRAFILEVSEQTSIKRLSARRICVKCGTIYNLITNPPPNGKCKCGGNLYQRKDDEPQAIKERLSAYKKVTEPLTKVLAKEKVLTKLNGERPIDEIFADIVKILTKNV